MQHKLIVLAVVAACVLLAALSVMASEFKTLDFLGSKKGTSPYSNLIFDTAGNLYGTTLRGGANNLGTIFELVPNANGGWAETVLYSFCSLAGCADGRFPSGGLIFDSSGNLYGITSNGGTNYDDGTAFELVAGANGTWTLKVLYSFCSVSECADGARPAGDLIFDTAGNLYGTTSGDGPGGGGAVFQLAPSANGTWTETVLHSFSGQPADGALPLAGVILDSEGRLYGTTGLGGRGGGCGAGGCGIVFELTPDANGKWTEKILHSFSGSPGDGENPCAALILDAAGNLYGTTNGGGVANDGTVFELSPSANGNWRIKLLHSFSVDWKHISGSLVFDSTGNLYGTAQNGGSHNLGIVFRLSQAQDGRWIETTVHSFTGAGGSAPAASLVLDPAGNLFGTASQGGRGCGNTGCGTIFEITP